MSSQNYLTLLLAAFAVNYAVRALPALFFSNLRLTPYFRRLLDLIPYTAITALVFPGIFYCVADHAYAAYAGTAVAVFCAFFKAPASVTVIVTVIAVYLLIVL